MRVPVIIFCPYCMSSNAAHETEFKRDKGVYMVCGHCGEEVEICE